MCPTDSRHRPDQRFMEKGEWDEANKEKERLQKRQRENKRRRETEAAQAEAEGREYEAYSPAWFKMGTDEITGAPIYRYTQEYWDCKQRQDWSRCPDIYS